MNAFSVDPAALDEARDLMDAFDKHVEKVCEDVSALVSNLHISWTGKGAEAHADAHRQWSEGAEQMRSAVRDLGASTGNAAVNYRGAVSTNIGMWPA